MKQHRLIDYHLHTAVTKDGKMSEAQACERAIQLGIQEIAFTNHIMHTEPAYSVSPDGFADHCKRVQACQQHYPELTIRLGLEIDYYESCEKEIAGTIKQFEAIAGRPIDLVLGSIHHLNGVFFSDKDEAPALYKSKSISALYQDYFILAMKAIRSGLFDVMAHPDLIKKFDGELTTSLPFELYRDVGEAYVDTLLDHGIGLEVNTKGYKLKVGQAYPTEEMLKLYLTRVKARGKEPVITLGSDAHKVVDVGGFILRGVELLAGLGQHSVMSFAQRVPTVFVL